MAKEKSNEPVVTTWIPEPHDHNVPATPAVEPVVEEVTE